MTAVRSCIDVRAWRDICGGCGRKPADIDAIADVLVSVSEMAQKETIIELDINPLIVTESGGSRGYQGDG